MFLTFEKGGHKYLVQVVDAHEGDGVLEIASPSDDGPADITELPGFTMTDLVQSMNVASNRGDCVAVLQSYRPRTTP